MPHERSLPRQAAPLLISEAEAARLLGVSLRTIQKLLLTGRLKSKHIGRRTLLRHAELVAFASAREGGRR